VWRRAEAAPGERRLAALAVLAIAAALGIAFWPLAAGRLFVYADLGNAFLPMRLFFAERIARGESALWMPNLFCGFFVHGEGQLGIYHPLRRLAYGWLPAGTAFALETALPLPIALAGFAVFLRRLGLPASAALFGGVCFGFSPYLTTRLTHLDTVAVLAHLGWLLWATDVLMRERPGSRRDLAWAALAALTGSQLLIGYPPAVALSLLVVGGYAVFLAARGAGLRPLLAVGSAHAVGLLLGAPQWLPTFEEIAASQRADPSYAFRAEQSLHPLNLLLPLSPWLFRDRVYQVEVFNPIEQSFYLGAVAPVATLWVLARWRRLAAWRGTFVALACASALSLALALGRYLPVHAWLADIPLLGLLRAPARYTLVVSLASALVAAVAFDDLRRAAAADPADARAARRAIWLAPALAWAIAGVALALRQEPAGPWPTGAGAIRPPGSLLWGPALVTLAALLFSAAARGLRLASLALFAFALADLAVYGDTLWWSEPPVTLHEYLESVPVSPAAPPDRLLTDYTMRIGRSHTGQGVYRTVTRLIVHDARLVQGYVGLFPTRRLDYRRPRALRLAGATYAEIDGRYERLAPPFARARLLARSAVSGDPARDLASFDLASTALVDAPLELVEGPPGRADLAKDVPGDIRIHTLASTRQLLVLGEAYHEGWKATSDGTPCRVLRVYGDFMGCVVEAGEHEVAFRFEPQSVEQGLRLALLGACAVVGVPGLAAARRRRPLQVRRGPASA
jgi:hypothetical protein